LFKTRTSTIIIPIILTIILTPYFLPTIPRAYGTNRSITLIGIVQGWNNTSTKNPTITVNSEDQISLTLTAGDLAVHRFFIDVARYGPVPLCPPDKCSQSFSQPNTVIFNFPADFPIGKYTYYCSVHPMTMFGTFTIAYASPFSAAGGRGPMPT
jgi:plastocyanin